MAGPALIIRQPDDWHIHLREEEVLQLTVPAVTRIFGRCLAMPNLKQPIVSLAQLHQYKLSIIKAGASQHQVKVALYLTQQMTPKFIELVAATKMAIGFKLYPAGATTNSQHGVMDITTLTPLFEQMEKLQIPLLIHGEVVDAAVDIFDREKVFIERHLSVIVDQFPQLKIVLEHITTREAVQFITESRENVVATITPQHLLLNRNDLLVGGLRPDNYCLPVLKRSTHQQVLIAAAISGNSKFFLGSDSAPHSIDKKYSDCGCAGCFTGLHCLELYAQIFDDCNALDKLENFASVYGAQFYGLSLNQRSVALYREECLIPEKCVLNDVEFKPFLAGQKLRITAKIVED